MTSPRYLPKPPSPAQCNFAGQRYGRLVVQSRVYRSDDPERTALWLCHCDCGTIIVKRIAVIRNGHTLSCGCLQRDLFSESRKTHGHSINDSAYMRWCSMKQRCTNPKNKNFARYGGRGISYDPAWESFEQFFDDMGPPPKGTCLDRIDNDGNYEKANCRWATTRESAHNTSRNVHIQLEGRTWTIAELASISGLTYTTIRKRIKRGWAPSRLTIKLKQNSQGVSP